jgi:hypothetical protein
MRQKYLRNEMSLFGFNLDRVYGLKYFELNKFSVMKCQRGKLFEHRELFPEQWNGAEFIAKYFKPKFFSYFSSKKSTISN